MSICLLKHFVQFLIQNPYSLHLYSITIWIFNILLLIFFLLELLARNVKWCKLQHAHIMVILSMTSSIISSSFFMLSDLHIFRHVFNRQFQNICLYAPLVALSFRIIAKHFTWALYIVRGQMVIASCGNRCTIQLSQKSPYILVIQYVVVTICIVIFTESYNEESHYWCQIYVPIWLLICSALIGEICYGLGFMYIFYKAMTKSLAHVYKSLPKKEVEEVKQQLRHHITIYFIQLTSSVVFLLYVSACVCYVTLVFFEAELFISNVCLLLLFRNKVAIFKKAIKSCLAPKDSAILAKHLQPLDISQKHSKSSRNLRSLKKRHANQFQLKKNAFASHFLANKWISETEVITVQKDILDTPTKTGIEMFYCQGMQTTENTNKQSNMCVPENKNHSRLPTMEALQIITDTMNLNLKYVPEDGEHQPGHRRNNTAMSATLGTPSFKLDVDALQTQSAPIQSDIFQIDSNIASLSAGQLDNVKTPKQQLKHFNIFGIFSDDNKSQSQQLILDNKNITKIDVNFMRNNENKKALRNSVSWKNKFKLTKKQKRKRSQSDTANEDIINIQKLANSEQKMVDKQSLLNEDFASVEPAELRSTLSSQQHEQYIKEIFTPEMSAENEENMVYLDDEFDFIDDKIDKMETIIENQQTKL